MCYEYIKKSVEVYFMNIKQWVSCHKYQIMMVVLMMGLFLLASCSTQSAPPVAPAGPIGGGCG